MKHINLSIADPRIAKGHNLGLPDPGDITGKLNQVCKKLEASRIFKNTISTLSDQIQSRQRLPVIRVW